MAKKQPSKKATEWIWVEIEEGKRWLSSHIPEGDTCASRVERSFSKGPNGQWGYYCWRSGQLLAMRPTVNEAKMRCERGGGRDRDQDNVLLYVQDYCGSVPPFLMLTEEERRAVRTTYAYAAPSAARERDAEARVGKQDARNLSDPSTKRFLEALERKLESAAPPVNGGSSRRPAATVSTGGTTKEQRSAVELPESGVMSRARDGNPKKEGSAAWKRWALMFEHCERGSTVKEFLAAGGNPETLKNATLKGFAQIIDKGGKK